MLNQAYLQGSVSPGTLAPRSGVRCRNGGSKQASHVGYIMEWNI